MSARVGAKVICDCKRCAALAVPKRLSVSHWRHHRKTYGVSDPLPSGSSTADLGSSNALQGQSLLNFAIRNHTNGNPSVIVETPADHPSSDPYGEVLSQSDGESLTDEGDDLFEEEELGELERESEIDDLSEASESEDDEPSFGAEYLNLVQGRVPAIGADQSGDGIDGDEDAEIRMLMTFSDLQVPESWKSSLRLFEWHCKFTSVSEAAYNDLQYNILPSYDVNIASLRKTRRMLAGYLGIRPVTYDCCENHCTVFIGENCLRRKCPFCGSLRFYGQVEDGSDFYPDEGAIANLKRKAKYSYLPLIPRLKLLYASPYWAKEMRYGSNLWKTPWVNEDGSVGRGLRDVWDGDGMRTLKERGYFADEREVAVRFSTDGVELFKNKRHETWPFMAVNLNLSPELRYNHDHLLPLSVTPGRRAPRDLDSFLLPFIEEMRKLHTGVPAYDAMTQSRFLLKGHIVLTTGDTPAISKIYHLSGHNAIYPCRLCMIKGFPYRISYTTISIQDGERVENTRTKHQYYYPLTPPSRGAPPHLRNNGPRYNGVDKIPVRTHNGYLQDGQASLNRPTESVSTGVKGLSNFALPKYNLDSVSFPESCPFDFMHLLHLGFGPDIQYAASERNHTTNFTY